MYNNPYQYQSYYPNYGQNYNYNMQANSQQRSMPTQQTQPSQSVQQTQNYETPIQNIRFLNSDEIKGYVVFPGTKEMLIDRAKGITYIKSANTMGESFSRIFRFEEISEEDLDTKKPEQPVIDTSSFVKRDDLKNFLTKEDLVDINTKLDKMEKYIRINDILKGDSRDGE